MRIAAIVMIVWVLLSVPFVSNASSATRTANATLLPSLYIDFEISPEVKAIVERAQRGFEVSKKDLKAAQQYFEKLAADLPASIPASLRRQIRSLACTTDDKNNADRLMTLTSRWIEATDATRDTEERAAYLLCQASLHFNASRHADAFTALAAAHELLIDTPRSIVFADLLVSRGYMASYLGDIEGATQWLVRARELYTELNFGNGIGVADLYLAHIYRYTGQNETAREIYNNLLATTVEEQNNSSLPLLYHAIAYTFKPKEESADALSWFQKGIDYAQKVDDKMALAHTHLAIGGVNAAIENWPRAIEHVNLTKRYAEQIGAHDLILRADLTLIEVEFATKPSEALLNKIKTLYAEFEHLGDMPAMIKVTQFQLKLLKKLRQFEEALAVADQLAELVKKRAEKNSVEATERMRATYQLERRVEENNRLREQHEIAAKELAAAREMRSLQFTVVILSLSLLIVISIWGYKQLRIRNTMQSLALTDELTKLANRRNIFSYADLNFAQSKTINQALSTIVFDVDHFKLVNDTHGHAGGDVVLQRIAQALLKVGRSQDRLGRTGGEEFMMVLPGANIDTATLVAERMRSVVEALSFDDIAPGFRVTISLGVSSKFARDHTFQDSVLRADNALYRAKRSGRNRVETEREHVDASSSDSAGTVA